MVSDDHGGLKSDIARHFQYHLLLAPIVHYARILLWMVCYARRGELPADLRAVFAAPDRRYTLELACHLEEHIE